MKRFFSSKKHMHVIQKGTVVLKNDNWYLLRNNCKSNLLKNRVACNSVFLIFRIFGAKML